MPGSFVSARFHADDNFGKPLVGGRLYTYANGTTIPAETYQDAAGTILNTNPIILDGRGEAVIFLTESQVYTFQLQNANGSVVWTQNDISPSLGTGGGSGGDGLQIYATAPATDVGPIYLTSQGPAEYIDGRYQSLYSMGFGGGGYGFKNKMRNSDFITNSRALVQYVFTAPSTGAFTLDNLKIFVGSNAKYTVTQVVGLASLQEGAQGRAYAVVTSTGAVSPIASDKNKISMAIEGSDAAEFGMGAGVVTPISISLRVNATIAGTYSASVSNAGGTRSYVFPLTVNAADTWEYKTVTLPADTLVPTSWNKSNGAGFVLSIDLGSGANFETASPNTWQNGHYTRTAGSIRLCSTNLAEFRMTQVQVEKGPVSTPYSFIPTFNEALWNNRYYVVALPMSTRATATGAGIASIGTAILSPSMRGSPALTLRSTGTQLNISTRVFGVVNNNGVRMEIVSAAAGDFYVIDATVDLDAEMSYV